MATMSLDARDRASIYTKLVPVLGEHEANVLMSQFPGSDADELVTRHFLRAELTFTRGELREEMVGLRTELQDEMAGLRIELRGEMAGLRTELQGEMAGLRTEVHDEIGALRTEVHDEIGALRLDMVERFRMQTAWMVGVLLAGMGLSATIATALG